MTSPTTNPEPLDRDALTALLADVREPTDAEASDALFVAGVWELRVRVERLACVVERLTSLGSMRQVIDALGEVYRDDGVAVWLAAEHQSGPLAGHRPIDLCRTVEGRGRVLAAVEVLTTGAFA